jgi:ABC-2 type transport system ATP-binding protein
MENTTATGLAGPATAQYLDEADQLADEIAVIDHGKIITEGTPGQLKAFVGTEVLRVRLAAPGDRGRAQQVLSRALCTVVHAAPDPVALTARIEGDATGLLAAEAVGRAMSQLAREGITITTFALGQPSLDEVFLALTGHAAQETGKEADVA